MLIVSVLGLIGGGIAVLSWQLAIELSAYVFLTFALGRTSLRSSHLYWAAVFLSLWPLLKILFGVISAVEYGGLSDLLTQSATGTILYVITVLALGSALITLLESRTRKSFS